ncbi:Germinal-center associated nuclear protein [Strongyloides ratti]|uniref:Germinal-center associated nuclear protein n=1 Tax=Strongyloides ratti TaxID=34506 RepID=A0A090KUM0_STRRB|nr:Germinal-center associated nuclear protein [Strongyloides ratti]CEF61180.1 Germinal-center associated nuclear protein [Strongyloides ratti]
MAFQFSFGGLAKNQSTEQTNKNAVSQESTKSIFGSSAFGQPKMSHDKGSDSNLSFSFVPGSSKDINNSSNDKKVSVFGGKSYAFNSSNTISNKLSYRNCSNDVFGGKDNDFSKSNKLSQNENSKTIFGKNIFKNETSENNSKMFNGKNNITKTDDSNFQSSSDLIQPRKRIGGNSLLGISKYLQKISSENTRVDSDTIKRMTTLKKTIYNNKLMESNNVDEEEFGVNVTGSSEKNDIKSRLTEIDSSDRASTLKRMHVMRKPQVPINKKQTFDLPDSLNQDISHRNGYNEQLNDVETQARKELITLVGKHCPSDMDKYELLKKRNQIMNKGRVIDTDYRTADSKIGTMENMCSELEYYTRIVQKRVSPYECNEDGSFNINLMIKDFERSAADQEYPLPHELRTEECLIKTLRYLFIMIVPFVPEDKHSQELWYDFIWHRTRSIRKDLMQQGINTENAVQIFETCARFHIFVSYRLCNLNALEFSQKLNNEHLSKSMHSIRHCYEDLAKENIFCKNEVEFSCYEMLMNLHDPKVLSKTNRFRREIMESDKMITTIKLVKEYQSNNYVKFFQIVKNECDFLQCCLLHRYFSDFRSRAMKIILTAYNNCTMHLEYLTDILALDDICDTMKLASFYHLDYSKSDPMLLILSRIDTTDIEIDEEYTNDKWIDGKLQNHLAAILLGTTDLEIPKFPEFCMSFDEKDCYSNDIVSKKFIEGNKMDPEKIKLLKEKRLKDEIINNYTIFLLEYILQNVKIDFIKSAFQFEIQVESCVKTISSDIFNNFENVRKGILKIICNEVFYTESIKNKEKLKKQKNDVISLYSTNIAKNLIDDIRFKNLKEIADNVLRNEIKISLDTEIISITKNLVYNVLCTTRNEIINNISLSVFKSEVVEVKKAIAKFKKRRINRIVVSCAKFWVNVARENIERRNYKFKTLSSLPEKPLNIPCSEVAKKFRIKRVYSFRDEHTSEETKFNKKPKSCGNIIKQLERIKFEQKLKEFIEKRRKRLAFKAFNIWLYNTKLIQKRRQVLTIFEKTNDSTTFSFLN